MLDTYFKSYFWTFNLAVLFGTAFLMARTVNAFIGSALDTPPSRIAEETPAIHAAGPAKRDDGIGVDAFLERNIFKAAREDLTPEPEAPLASDASREFTGVVDMSNCEPTSMRANLLATLVSSDESASVAVFQDTGASVTIAHRVGERIMDEAEIVVIQQRNVLIQRNGRCEILSLEDEPKAAHSQAAPSEPVASSAAPSGDFGKDVKQVSESEYEIPREEIDNVLSNLNQIATQARIVPSFNNGKANGFKLFSIRPNSLYSKIGIQNGDIVQKINGYEINSPDKALEIYSKLKDAQAITVDLVRRGKQQTLSYNIR